MVQFSVLNDPIDSNDFFVVNGKGFRLGPYNKSKAAAIAKFLNHLEDAEEIQMAIDLFQETFTLEQVTQRIEDYRNSLPPPPSL